MARDIVGTRGVYLINETAQEDFIQVFRFVSEAIHANNVAHEWTDREDGTMLMLIVSELGECLEALRVGNPPSEHIPEFTGAEEELADGVIRAIDLCTRKGWRLAEAIVAKMKYNESRPVRHNGKAF